VQKHGGNTMVLNDYYIHGIYIVFQGIVKNIPRSKNAGLFQPKFGSNIDKPSNWVNLDDILIDIFNPKFGFVHILPKIWLKQPSIF